MQKTPSSASQGREAFEKLLEALQSIPISKKGGQPCTSHPTQPGHPGTSELPKQPVGATQRRRTRSCVTPRLFWELLTLFVAMTAWFIAAAASLP